MLWYLLQVFMLLMTRKKKTSKGTLAQGFIYFFPLQAYPCLRCCGGKMESLDLGILSARLPPHILFPSTSPISYWWALQQFKLHVFFKHLTSKESNHTLCSNPASAEKCKCYCCEREIRKGYLEKFRLSILIADWLCLTGMTRTRERENESTPHGGSFWSSALDRWQYRIAIYNIKQQVALKDLPCCIYVLLNGWQLHKTIKQDASLIFAVKSTERSLTLFHRQKRDCFPYTCEYSSGSSFFQTEVYVSSLRKWIQTDFLRVDNGCDIAVLFPHH